MMKINYKTFITGHTPWRQIHYWQGAKLTITPQTWMMSNYVTFTVKAAMLLISDIDA